SSRHDYSQARGLSSYMLSDAALSTYIYTLSLHVALPISSSSCSSSVMKCCLSLLCRPVVLPRSCTTAPLSGDRRTSALLSGFAEDRKSTRLKSSHVKTSYAVFCLKKKSRFD